MFLKKLALPALVAATLAVATPDQAEAAPIHTPVQSADAVFGGVRVHVGGGVRIPIGHRHRGRTHVVRQRVVTYEGGYWTTETRKVWHPAEFVGYDRHGRPVYSPGHYDYVEERVWVPRRQVVRYVESPRYYHPRRTRGHVHVGVGVRLR